MTRKKKKMLNKIYKKLSVKDKKELRKLIIFGKKIEEEVKNEQTNQEETTIYCK